MEGFDVLFHVFFIHLLARSKDFEDPTTDQTENVAERIVNSYKRKARYLFGVIFEPVLAVSKAEFIKFL